MIALGNGADAIIGYLCTAFLRPGDEVITGWPSFPTYLTDAAKQEAVVKLAPLSDGAFDLEAIAELIGPRTRLIWVCSPNNPTGGVVTPADFRRFVDAVPESVLVVVDEAYYEFAAGPDQLDCIAEYVRERPNVAALRTFSKLYGLAGLRVGYLAGPESIVTAVAKSRHYYDLTGLSAVAALASLDSPDEVQRRRRVNQQQRAALEAALSEHGWHSYPSHGQFPRRRSRRRRRDRRATARGGRGDALAQRAGRARAAAGHGRDRCRVRAPGGNARSRGRAGALILIRQLDRARIT